MRWSEIIFGRFECPCCGKVVRFKVYVWDDRVIHLQAMLECPECGFIDTFTVETEE